MRRWVMAACAAAWASPAFALDSVLVASGLDSPLFLTAPAGDPRLFIVEQGGRIRLWHNGTLSTYLDISGQVDSSGERGLLGLAFDPAFASNGRFYVNYIDKVTLNTVVAAYNAPSAASTAADPSSGRTILTVPQAPYNNHKAGWIGFRPGEPNHLYIATGDGGSANDPGNRAQDLSNNLGKILRVTPQAAGGYTVPADNPFVGSAGNDETWAWGLRNPDRNAFDRATGDFWIADVGQDAREEINLELAGTAGGRNYGWRALEGSADNPAVPDAPPPGAVMPAFEYTHASGLGESIIGGFVYRGHGEAGLDGRYVFGDFVSGRIFSVDENGGVVGDLVEHTEDLGTPFSAFQLTSFGEDGLGNLYAMGLDGNVYRIANAVPEADVWLMLATGAMVLGFLHRRRRRDG